MNESLKNRPLEDLVEKIIGGGTPSRKNKDFYHGSIPWFTVKDLVGIFLEKSQEFITEEAVNKSSANLIPAQSVIVATRMALGKAFINEVDIAINQDLKALIPNRKVIIPTYLLYAILQKSEEILRMGSGTTVKGIRLEQLKKIEIFVPNIKEQQKIAAILTSVDKAIEKTEAIIEQTETVKKGLMQELLTKGIGHTEFKETDIGKIPMDWTVVPLSMLISSLKGGVSVNSENRIKTSSEKGILKTSAVTSRKFNPMEHKAILPTELDRVTVSPEKGQIIISRMNTPLLVGSSSYIDRDYNDLFLPDRLWQTKINDNCNALWLSYVLTWSFTRSRISEIATGTSNSMKNISKKVFLNLRISLPTLSEQERISDTLFSVDSKITIEQQRLLKLKTMKQGLMHDLLTSKVRVQVDDPEVIHS